MSSQSSNADCFDVCDFSGHPGYNSSNYDSDDSLNWDGSRDPEPLGHADLGINPDQPDAYDEDRYAEGGNFDRYGDVIDDHESLRMLEEEVSLEALRTATFELPMSEEMAADTTSGYYPAEIYREVIMFFLRNWRDCDRPIKMLLDIFRKEGVPIAKTSKKLLFKNAVALCERLSAPALFGLCTQFALRVNAETMYASPAGEIFQTTPQPVGRFSVQFSDEPTVITPSQLFLQYQRFAPLILAVLFGTLLAVLFGKLAYFVGSWLVSRIRKVYNERKFRSVAASTFDLDQISSYECLGVYNKMKGPDGSIHWVQHSPLTSIRESAQFGSIPLKTDKTPITLLKIFVNTEFIGMAVRYNDWLVATSHELAPICDKDKVTIMCVANGKTYDYTYKTAELYSDFTIVNTPFTDVSAIRVPNKVWSALGVNGSVVPFKAHSGSTVSITAFGSTAYDVLTTFSSSGLIKIDHMESEHTASTQRGWSGTPLYAGQFNAKQPQVVAIHHTGSKNSMEGNTATIFLPVAAFLDRIRDSKKEDSADYFAKNALSRFDSMAAEENHKNYYIDHTSDDVWYSDPHTFKTMRLDMDEYEAFMNNDRAYFEDQISERQRLREQNEDEERLMGEAISAPPVRGVRKEKADSKPKIDLDQQSAGKKSKKKTKVKESAPKPAAPVTDDQVMFEKFKAFMASNFKGNQKAQALPSQ
jgi:hypothetical protein